MSHNAHNKIVNIHGGVFNQIAGDYHFHGHAQDPISQDDSRKQEVLKFLFDHIALGAFHDSEDERDRPKCHPRTREAILQKIMKWARDPNNARLLMWIYGPAGAGKSAIMQTMAELCEAAGLMGASFFFFRTDAARNAKTRLVPTLAYQLVRRVPRLGGFVLSAIRNDPSVFSRALAAQMQALAPVVFVDGLDECAPEDAHREIIALLADAASPLQPFRFLVASRPELVIRDAFAVQAARAKTQTLALDNTFHPDADIERFLADRFRELARRHPARRSIPRDWPSADDIQTIVAKASGQLIYAATVIKFIDFPRGNPTQRLAAVLQSRGSSDAPFARLEELYYHILAAVEDITRVMHILVCILYLGPHFDSDLTTGLSLEYIEKLLGYPDGDASIVLCDMHSLVDIGSDDMGSSDDVDATFHLVTFHHTSLGDFLADPMRSRHIYADPAEACTSIVTCMIERCDDLIYKECPQDFLRLLMAFLHAIPCTVDLQHALFNFNVYKYLSASMFNKRSPDRRGDIWDNIFPLDDTLWDIIICPLNSSRDYLRNQKENAADPPDSPQLYSASVAHLDTWLADILRARVLTRTNFLFCCILGMKPPAARARDRQWYVAGADADAKHGDLFRAGFALALQEALSDPRRASCGLLEPGALLHVCARYTAGFDADLSFDSVFDYWIMASLVPLLSTLRASAVCRGLRGGRARRRVSGHRVPEP